jgi:hypothetical protein
MQSIQRLHPVWFDQQARKAASFYASFVLILSKRVNNINKRLDNLVAWLGKTEPDVTRLRWTLSDAVPPGGCTGTIVTLTAHAPPTYSEV